MIFQMPNCGGCRTCELACSFKHTGTYNPEVSSIQILDNPDAPGFQIRLVENSDGTRFACDLCSGSDAPVCLEYCHEKEILQGFLLELGKKTQP